MLYADIRTNIMKVYRLLSYVLYAVIESYVFIEYICCQSKKLSFICYDKISEDRSYNEFIGIGIP